MPDAPEYRIRITWNTTDDTILPERKGPTDWIPESVELVRRLPKAYRITVEYRVGGYGHDWRIAGESLAIEHPDYRPEPDTVRLRGWLQQADTILAEAR